MSWLEHVKEYREKHPNLTYKEALVKAKATYKKRGKGIKDIINKIKEKFFFPPNRLPPSSQKVFMKHRDLIVQNVTVRRIPIFSAIDKAINLISLGTFNKGKQLGGYDKMFHLSMILTTSKGKIVVEKNERVDISEKIPTGGETVNANYQGKLTLDAFLDKAKRSMGEHKFFQYNAFENNCQDFVLGILKANGISGEIVSFVKQPTDVIIKSMPKYVGKISQGITDLGGKLRQLLEGGKKR